MCFVFVFGYIRLAHARVLFTDLLHMIVLWLSGVHLQLLIQANLLALCMSIRTNNMGARTLYVYQLLIEH